MSLACLKLRSEPGKNCCLFPLREPTFSIYNFEDATQVEKLLEGSSILEKVVLLELECLTVNSLLDQWISGFVQRCPNLSTLWCAVVCLNLNMA